MRAACAHAGCVDWLAIAHGATGTCWHMRGRAGQLRTPEQRTHMKAAGTLTHGRKEEMRPSCLGLKRSDDAKNWFRKGYTDTWHVCMRADHMSAGARKRPQGARKRPQGAVVRVWAAMSSACTRLCPTPGALPMRMAARPWCAVVATQARVRAWQDNRRRTCEPKYTSRFVPTQVPERRHLQAPPGPIVGGGHQQLCHC